MKGLLLAICVLLGTHSWTSASPTNMDLGDAGLSLCQSAAFWNGGLSTYVHVCETGRDARGMCIPMHSNNYALAIMLIAYLF